MIRKSTHTAQNILAGLIKDMVLEAKNPSPGIKRQYFKAEEAVRKARFELDILNDMIERNS